MNCKIEKTKISGKLFCPANKSYSHRAVFLASGSCSSPGWNWPAVTRACATPRISQLRVLGPMNTRRNAGWHPESVVEFYKPSSGQADSPSGAGPRSRKGASMGTASTGRGWPAVEPGHPQPIPRIPSALRPRFRSRSPQHDGAPRGGIRGAPCTSCSAPSWRSGPSGRA